MIKKSLIVMVGILIFSSGIIVPTITTINIHNESECENCTHENDDDLQSSYPICMCGHPTCSGNIYTCPCCGYPPPPPPQSPPPPTLYDIPSPNDNGIIKLDWTSSSGATSYKIYRSDAEFGTYTLIATISSLSYTDTITPGIYWYYVRAHNYIGDSSPSNREGVEVYQPPEPIILHGSTQRFFPHMNTAKLGFTIYTEFAYSPKIDLVVTETATCSYNVNLKVKIDNTLVFDVSGNFYSTEEFFNIDGSLLQSVGTHQILIELTNGDGPNDIYRLEYLKIKNLHFKNSESYANNRYSPAQIWQYDSQYDNVVVTFGDDVPFLNDDFRTDDVQGIEFWPSITIQIDPDLDGKVIGIGPFLKPIVINEWEYYIHNYKIDWKVIDKNGNYLTSSSAEFNKLNNYGCQIGVSDGNRAENYEAIEFLLRCLETAFIIGTAIYELAPYITIPIDLFLTWLQFGSDPPRSSQNFIDDRTYQVAWTNGIEGSGPWTWPTLKLESASMLAEWDFEFFDTGQYQIQYHWTLTTRKFRSWKIFPYYQETLPGFTLEGDYYVNFEFY